MKEVATGIQKPNIILALDVDSLGEVSRFVDLLYPDIKIFKVGIHLFTAFGPKVVEVIRAKGAEVFLDLKFFDIPNTVANAVRQAVSLKVKMLTVHILGDEEMLRQAISAAQDESKKQSVTRPLIIGVTVLTSKEVVSSDVLTLASIGIDCGLDGVVCSAREAGLLRQNIKKDFVIVTPGIRAEGSQAQDQKRTATVSEAVKAGSDYLVVGRPILQASDPAQAAKKLLSLQ
ncbi:MAG: orotidine-5'-phosphate decarboxylase [Candidatus Omnitrophica bacterium]|nr:orotidine-5'-phosphate decarboxylase [Candidatus Omnitrophota bacterium]